MNTYSENISVNVSKDMKETLQDISKSEELNLSSTIRQILKKGIQTREKINRGSRDDL